MNDDRIDPETIKSLATLLGIAVPEMRVARKGGIRSDDGRGGLVALAVIHPAEVQADRDRDQR